MLWKRFLFYTKAKKPAGAFVSWWRRGRLTSGDHYWATIEALSKKKKGVPNEKLDERERMSSMSREEWLHQEKTKAPKTSKNETQKAIPLKKKPLQKNKVQGIGNILPQKATSTITSFDYKMFKANYAKEHERIAADILTGLEKIYQVDKKEKQGTSKVREIEKRVVEMLPSYCERWFKEHVLEEK